MSSTIKDSATLSPNVIGEIKIMAMQFANENYTNDLEKAIAYESFVSGSLKILEMFVNSEVNITPKSNKIKKKPASGSTTSATTVESNNHLSSCESRGRSTGRLGNGCM